MSGVTPKPLTVPDYMLNWPLLEIFRAGYDTMQIAAAMGSKEHLICKQLRWAREAERRHPNSISRHQVSR